jgi:rare lipoprotein A (peptidoglycan hydrolase)
MAGDVSGANSPTPTATSQKVYTGKPSFYKTTGNPTANGEVYDPKAMTAAMRRVPFEVTVWGTMVLLVRIETRA